MSPWGVILLVTGSRYSEISYYEYAFSLIAILTNEDNLILNMINFNFCTLATHIFKCKKLIRVIILSQHSKVAPENWA